MARSDQTYRKQPTARTEEAREKQMMAYAVDLAEQQLKNGTASSQVLTHYLKLASSKEKVEKEILEEKKKLITAQTEALQSQKRTEEMYKDAITALGIYSGSRSKDDEDDDYDR